MAVYGLFLTIILFRNEKKSVCRLLYREVSRPTALYRSEILCYGLIYIYTCLGIAEKCIHVHGCLVYQLSVCIHLI